MNSCARIFQQNSQICHSLPFLGSFFAFKLKKNKLKDGGGAGNQGGNTSLHQLIDNKHQTSPHQGGHLNQGYASNTFNRVKKMPTQKPDIIERQVKQPNNFTEINNYYFSHIIVLHLHADIKLKNFKIKTSFVRT